jgi:flagellar hook-length control protein FliK
MTPIAASAPVRPAPAPQPKAADTDDRFAAMVDDGFDTETPAPADAPPKDTPAAKPAQATKPAAAATLAALIAAANGEAAPAAPPLAADATAAPEAKPEGEPAADPKAEAKPADKDAPAPALPVAAPVLAPTPTPLVPAPHVAAPTTKAAPKHDEATATATTESKATHTATAPADAPAPMPAKPETAPTGDFKAALDSTIAAPQPHTTAVHIAVPDAPAVTVRPGQIGAETGIQIARQINAGENEFLLRLNPAEHGHIQIHMRFAEDGALRAVISADSATVLDMLRKDSGDLGRALGHAGVRTDAQSFSFGSQGQPDGQRQHRGGGQGWSQTAADQTEDTPLTRFRPLHGGLGVLDRLA